jgi:hypothetical protein
MKRLLATMALGMALLSACGAHAVATPKPADSCTPPAGGRCAGDVPWGRSIIVSADGRQLGGIVLCGGTLHATETDDRVTIRLHVGAMGPGTMTCARVSVEVTLREPLGTRTVVDAVTGRTVQVGDSPFD